MAEAHSKGGDFYEGIATLNDAITVAEKTGICLYEPEIYRLKGEFLLSLETETSVKYESCFKQAVELARRHQTKSLELRASMSLARLWQRQGRSSEGRDALAAIYCTFAEGFTTPDLLDAAAQLSGIG